VKRYVLQCVAAALVACACSKGGDTRSRAEPPVGHAPESAGLVLYRSSPVEGLVGEWSRGDGKIFFDVHRRDGSDPVAARDQDSGRSAQARIRDSRGVTLWGVGSGLELPSVDEQTKKNSVTAPPSAADLELVKRLPDVLKASGIDAQALSLELSALEGASAAFRGVDGPGGPAPRSPSISKARQ